MRQATPNDQTDSCSAAFIQNTTGLTPSSLATAQIEAIDSFDIHPDPANQRFSRSLLDHAMAAIANHMPLMTNEHTRDVVTRILLGYFPNIIEPRSADASSSLTNTNDAVDSSVAQTALSNLIRQQQHPSVDWSMDCTVTRNIALLRQTLSLNDVECKLLAMAYCALNEPKLGETLMELSISNAFLRNRQLAVLLDVPLAEIKRTFAHGNRLATLGLVDDVINECETKVLAYFVASERLVELLTVPMRVTGDIMDRLAVPVRPTVHDESDFSHWTDIATLMARCIESAHRNKTLGTNILLFGKPGTGKTELARHVARLANARLCEVDVHNADGSNVASGARIANVQLLQTAFANTADDLLPVVLCDDADDLFAFIQHGSTKRQSSYARDYSRAWMNAKLETNAVATIWIVNSIEHVELSYRRRFTLSFAIDGVPRSKRRHMVDRLVAEFQLSRDFHSALVELRSLLPYHFSQLTKLLRVPGNDERDALQWLQRNAELFDSPDISAIRSLHESTNDLLPLQYSNSFDWRYVAIDDMARKWLEPVVGNEEAAAIAAFPQRVSVLFCNADAHVAGCGKSSLVSRIATVLDKELITLTPEMMTGSTLGHSVPSLSQYFAYATAQNYAICLHHIDEPFSESDEQNATLPNPSVARYETRLSTSLITELRAFDGIVFATTTDLKNLPQTLISEFDHRVNIAPLRYDQLLELIRQSASDLVGSEISPETVLSVQALEDKVSIGEFKRALRRSIGLNTGSRKHVKSNEIIEMLMVAASQYSSNRVIYH